MPDFQGQTVHRNEILSALQREQYQRLLPYLKSVSFSLGQVVCPAGERQELVYFPTDAVLSLVHTTQNGSTTEVAVVGNDGMLGIAAVLGGDSMLYHAVAQIAGHAFAIRAKTLEGECFGCLQQALLRYAQALLTQVSQTAVCNRLHSMQQRLCRWLLLWQERAHSDELRMTQEAISQMLGGRRESVTVAAGFLQNANVIEYSRGHIRIVDRIALEKMACECYTVVKGECDRLRRMVHEADRRDDLIRA